MLSIFTASKGQVLELPILQVYLCVWCDECPDNGGGGTVGCLVYCARFLPSPDTAVQG